MNCRGYRGIGHRKHRDVWIWRFLNLFLPKPKILIETRRCKRGRLSVKHVFPLCAPQQLLAALAMGAHGAVGRSVSDDALASINYLLQHIFLHVCLPTAHSTIWEITSTSSLQIFREAISSQPDPRRYGREHLSAPCSSGNFGSVSFRTCFSEQVKVQELISYAIKLGEWFWMMVSTKVPLIFALFPPVNYRCRSSKDLTWAWTSSWWRSCQVCLWDPLDSPWHPVLLPTLWPSRRNTAAFFLNTDIFMSCCGTLKSLPLQMFITHLASDAH